jgi:hypothetical protein
MNVLLQTIALGLVGRNQKFEEYIWCVNPADDKTMLSALSLLFLTGFYIIVDLA